MGSHIVSLKIDGAAHQRYQEMSLREKPKDLRQVLIRTKRSAWDGRYSETRRRCGLEVEIPAREREGEGTPKKRHSAFVGRDRPPPVRRVICLKEMGEEGRAEGMPEVWMD